MSSIAHSHDWWVMLSLGLNLSTWLGQDQFQYLQDSVQNKSTGCLVKICVCVNFKTMTAEFACL